MVTPVACKVCAATCYDGNTLLLLLLLFVALLRAVAENPRMKELLGSGWESTFELCNGAPSGETFWTGVECLDPYNRPGVVSKMWVW